MSQDNELVRVSHGTRAAGTLHFEFLGEIFLGGWETRSRPHESKELCSLSIVKGLQRGPEELDVIIIC